MKEALNYIAIEKGLRSESVKTNTAKLIIMIAFCTIVVRALLKKNPDENYAERNTLFPFFYFFLRSEYERL